MTKKMKKGFLLTLIFGFLSILFIILVKTVDVQPIGPNYSAVGFASMNGAFRDFAGQNPFLYTVTKILAVVAILLGCLFTVKAVIQFLQSKSLRDVDTCLILLVGLYVLLGLIYVFFELVIVNYRPIIMEGKTELEASFPSSHTLLMCTIFGTAIIAGRKLIKSKNILLVFQVACAAGIVIAIVGRLFSGVHWLSDILAAMLFSATLISAYYGLYYFLQIKRRQREREYSFQEN